VAGEVLYLSKCGVTAVRFRRSEHCWNAIPVTEISTNASKFMNAITHKLSDFAEKIPCSVASPPVYQINNTFLEINPVIRPAREPEILAPSTKPSNFLLMIAFRTQVYIQKKTCKITPSNSGSVKRARLVRTLSLVRPQTCHWTEMVLVSIA